MYDKYFKRRWVAKYGKELKIEMKKNFVDVGCNLGGGDGRNSCLLLKKLSAQTSGDPVFYGQKNQQ